MHMTIFIMYSLDSKDSRPLSFRIPNVKDVPGMNAIYKEQKRMRETIKVLSSYV